MSPFDLVAAINGAVPQLLKPRRSLTWNDISDHCLFVLSEITDEPTDAHQRRRQTKRLNDAKQPLPLADLAPALHQLRGNVHDLNLYIYRATRGVTIVDVRYYPRSSLAPAYRAQDAELPPLLHVKVATLPWVALAQRQPKFDVNWERQVTRTWWRMRWLKYQFSTRSS
ncbi:hypothetical protein [Hymenobacter nivis]|uniref:Uncharacterized protein n=1 Tax=Hymenobacter nivis TaxID=1850093 RepID=A0A502GB92_9BACT|nr:hypothetical protein [Hymenobacter nivis]TPG58952.1 hypothetical protein EAH73_21780 [Hymenobacter nivis]